VSILRPLPSRRRPEGSSAALPVVDAPVVLEEGEGVTVEVIAGETVAIATVPPFRPSAAGWAARGLVLATVAALVLIVPLTRDSIEAHIFTQAAIFAIIGLSLNMLLGYTGQISLGHQAFVGIGAFTSAYMVSVHGQPFLAGVAAAVAVGALQALALGAVSLRVTGLYFALVTLAYGTMAEESLFNIQSLTGGSAGQPAPKPALFSTDYRYYYLCLAFLAVVIWIDWRLMKTKGGRALLALRENPRVAATFGTDVKAFTLMAFVVAGAFAGLGGALLAHNDTFVVRDLFNFQLALVFVIMTTVGGLRSRVGVVIGSAFFSLIPYFFDKLHLEKAVNAIPFVKALPKEYAPIVIGPLLLLFTLTHHPGGVGQQVKPIQRWLSGKRFSFKDTDVTEVRVSDVRA
jgi:branched-chain amino acid transport system permease protein